MMRNVVANRKKLSRMSRAERQEDTRRKLLAAAAEAVGEFGYSGASVGKITAMAGVAQGTFYNYFESQEDLFNQLLPSMGNELIEFIRERVSPESESLKREELGFRAFFAFLESKPAFYRVLNDAEAFAPKAYRDHMANMARGYTRALEKAAQKGELRGFEPHELEVLVYILLSARNYLSYRFCFRSAKPARLPGWVVDVYMKFVTGGFHGGGLSPPRLRTAQARRSRNSSPEHVVLDQSQNSARLTTQLGQRNIEPTAWRAAIASLADAAVSTVVKGAGLDESTVAGISIDFQPVPPQSTLMAQAMLTVATGSTGYVSVSIFDITETILIAQAQVRIVG